MDNLVPLAGIYVITHIPTGRKYVGQGVDVDARVRSYRHSLGHGEIGAAIREHGIGQFSFEIVERFEDERMLNAREQHWIQALGSTTPNGYNSRSLCNSSRGYMHGDQAMATDERQARYRAATKTAGGVRVDVHIGPEAAAVLARMREIMTVRTAIEEALRCSEMLAEMLSRSTVYSSAIEADHDFYLDEWEARLRRVGAFLNPPAPAAPPTSAPAPAD